MLNSVNNKTNYFIIFRVIFTILFPYRIKYTMNIQEFDEQSLTILAFLIGLAIIDCLDSTEQAAVGGFIMLIGQTVSTNSGFKFNKDWKKQTGNSDLASRYKVRR